VDVASTKDTRGSQKLLVPGGVPSNTPEAMINSGLVRT
jgi:hypothetical protein